MSWRRMNAALTPASMVCVWMVTCPTTVCATTGLQDPGGCTDCGLSMNSVWIHVCHRCGLYVGF